MLNANICNACRCAEATKHYNEKTEQIQKEALYYDCT